MTGLHRITLSRRESILALTYAVTLGPLTLAGCGGGGSNAGGSGNTTGSPVNGKVQVPAGLAGRTAEMRLFTGLGDSAIAADGSFTARTIAEMPTVGTLMLADKPVLVGFLDTTLPANLLDAKSCAVILLFTALGGWQITVDRRPAIIALIAQDPATATLAQTIADRLAADPYALINQDAQIVAALSAAVNTIAPNAGRAAGTRSAVHTERHSGTSLRAIRDLLAPSGATRATRAGDITPSLLLNPTGLINGFEVVQDGDLQAGFSMINHQRRSRRARLYRVGVVDQNDVETRYPTAVPVGDALAVSATDKLGLLNAIGDVLNATAPWSPIQTSRVALPLEPNTHKTLYEIVTLSASFDAPEPAFFSEPKYSGVVETWRKDVGDLNEAIYFELAFDLILETLGLGGLKYSEAAFAEAIANVKNFGAGDVASILVRARGGEALSSGVLSLIQLAATSDIVSSKYMAALAPLYKTANARLASEAVAGTVNARQIQRFRGALRILLIVGLIATAVDIGAQVHDLRGGDRGNLTTADVYVSSVRLNPASVEIMAGDTATFSASVPGSVGANIVYAWSLSGSNLANLRDDSSGKVGTSFETPGRVVVLATTPSTVGTLTVTVEAFSVQTNGTRKSLGTALGQAKINNDVPNAAVKINFTALNPGGTGLTSDPLSMPAFDPPTLNSFQGNPVVVAVFSNLRTTGKNDAFKVEMWFDTTNVKVGTQVSFGPGKNSTLVLRLPFGSTGGEVNFTPLSGTLTVLEVSPILLGGFIKFSLDAALRTPDPDTNASIHVIGSAVGIEKA